MEQGADFCRVRGRAVGGTVMRLVWLAWREPCEAGVVVCCEAGGCEGGRSCCVKLIL